MNNGCNQRHFTRIWMLNGVHCHPKISRPRKALHLSGNLLTTLLYLRYVTIITCFLRKKGVRRNVIQECEFGAFLTRTEHCSSWSSVANENLWFPAKLWSNIKIPLSRSERDHGNIHMCVEPIVRRVDEAAFHRQNWSVSRRHSCELFASYLTLHINIIMTSWTRI